MKTEAAWSARCDCYNGHSSASGRCTCRHDGHTPAHLPSGLLPKGVFDPTRFKGEAAICEDCRAHCPAGNGNRNPETGEKVK